MGTAFLDEGDARPAVPAEGVAETGDELEPRRAAAYGPDMMDSDFLVSNRIGRWRLRRDIEQGGFLVGHAPLPALPLSLYADRRARALRANAAPDSSPRLVVTYGKNGSGAGSTFSGSSASSIVSRSRWACMRVSSSAPSHLATTTVARPFPIRLVKARASDIKRSTPRISAMLATGMVPTEASVAASTMKPLPVTPAAPFEVRSNTPMMPSCEYTNFADAAHGAADRSCRCYACRTVRARRTCRREALSVQKGSDGPSGS